MNIADLIKEARQGSTAAQRYLFDHLADRMMTVCCRYVKSREDAEEIMLDGFFKFFKAINQFNYQGEAAMYGWIKKIMINECLMFLRKKNVFTMVADTGQADQAVPENALDNLSADEIFALIVQLPVGYRTVFNLYAVEGMTHDDIASLLSISSGTSKSQLSKARILLQKMLAQKGISYVRHGSK